ncbi:MAG: glycine cleavage system protein GcvH [Candidatus Eisenbacteria bacterium]
MTPEGLRYTKDHEWARTDGDLVVVGITHYAQDQLGDVVFVELPAVGRTLEAGQSFGVIEAVKTVSDLYAPMAGEIVEVNAALAGEPALVNQAPYEAGWMVKIRPSNAADLDHLLDASAYRALLEAQHA